MIYFYKHLTNLLYPIIIIFIYCRKLINKEDPNRYKEKLFSSHFNIKRKKNLKLIWFHAASIGEVKSILPIIHELNSKRSDLEFLITTVTLSSSIIIKEETKKLRNVTHRFFPADIDFLIKRFLRLWNPYAIFFVDSEIWPNLIIEAKKLKIFLIIINARITSKTFNRWFLIHKAAKEIFGSFDLCLCSNSETKKYLRILNAKNILNNGNIKLTSKISNIDLNKLNKSILSKRKFWCAISTHKGEEDICLRVHLNLKKKVKNILTILAPRHINRVIEIENLCEKLNLSFQTLNEKDSIDKNKEIIIINHFGALPKYLKYSKSVFIGKSLLKNLILDGGQSPIEAAKLGCKVYHGPYVYNFKEIYQILHRNNISKKIKNIADLTKNLLIDFTRSKENNNNKFNAIMKNLEKKIMFATMKNINKLLFNEIK